MFEILTIQELLEKLEKGKTYKELHLHHTWKPNHSNFNGNNGLELQENMQKYHKEKLGWDDIGQHVTLLPDGKFVTGRSFSKNPASISGKNTGAFACEMLGNFDKGNDEFKGEQKESALKLAKFFDDKGIYVRFHNENSSKTCPGTSIAKTEFMTEVKTYGQVKSSGGSVETPKAEEVKTIAKPKTETNSKVDTKVLETQKKLNKLKFVGANRKPLTEDGINGTNTDFAIKKYQSTMALTVDGVFGANSERVYKDIVSKPLLEKNRQYVRIVRYLQYRLGLKVDGWFASNTYKAVKVFQKANKLYADGIVGNNTWKKLIG